MVLVGVSLSFCIRSLLKWTQVWTEGQKIVLVTCTAMPSPEEAYVHYGKTYWRGYSKETVMALLKRIWPYVVQPRLLNNRYEHFAGGDSWFTTQTLNPREITNTIMERDEDAGRSSLLEFDEILVPLQAELLRVLQSQISA